ncbi:hypothetical protein ACOMHN_041597 [Nucella lapillus]
MTPTQRRRRCRNDVDSDDVTATSHVSGSSRPSTALSGSTLGTGTETRTLSSARSSGTQEVDDLTYRLMKPTIAWNIRSDLREGNVIDPVAVVTHRVRVKGHTGRGRSATRV